MDRSVQPGQSSFPIPQSKFRIREAPSFPLLTQEISPT
jgi:hypothetical protein